MKGKCHTTRFFSLDLCICNPHLIYHRNNGKNSQSKQISFSIYGQVEFWNTFTEHEIYFKSCSSFIFEHSSTKSIRLMLTCFFNLRDYLTVVRILKTFFFSLIHKNNVERRQQKKITSCTMSLIFKKKTKAFFS